MPLILSLRRVVLKVEDKSGKRFSNVALARELDLSQPTVNRLMSDNGTSSIGVETLAAIRAFCKRHGVVFDIDDMMVER